MQRLSPRTLTSLVIAERIRAERVAYLVLKTARENLDSSSLREQDAAHAAQESRSLFERLRAAVYLAANGEKKILSADPKALRTAVIAADFSQPIASAQPDQSADPQRAEVAPQPEPQRVKRPLSAAELCLFADAAVAAQQHAEAALASLALARDQHKQAAQEVDRKEGEWRLAAGRRKAAERYQTYQRRDEKRLRAQLVRDQEEEARDRYASGLRQSRQAPSSDRTPSKPEL